MKEVVNAIIELRQHVAEIAAWIGAANKARSDDHETLVKLFSEQKQINEDLQKRLKSVEDTVCEQYLLGDKNEKHQG